MADDPNTHAPDVDPELLVAQLEYARWAARRMLDAVKALPAEALTRPVTSSFPTLLATLQHVFGWDKYYLVHLKGGHVERAAVPVPASFEELEREWAAVHAETIAWAREHVAARKDLVLEGWGAWPTWMIILQMASHATHHYGQVVTLLRQLGYPQERMDSTDLILYLLRRYPQPNQKPWVQAIVARDQTPLEAPVAD